MSQPPNTRSSSAASGTTSLIFGERPSVRLPRRMVPIWVSEPIGLARPLRMAMTPAMVVVLTAPRPTSRMPSLPRAGAMSTGVGTNENYIAVSSQQSAVDRRLPTADCRLPTADWATLHCPSMLMNPFTRRAETHLLAVSMTGVKMGDRVAFVGCAHGGRLAAIASKVGLSGRAVAVVPDDRTAAVTRKGAEEAGVLVEIEVSRRPPCLSKTAPSTLPSLTTPQGCWQ